MTLKQFIDYWRGRSDCDYDRKYGAQCVDLFNYYGQDVVKTGRLYTPSTGGAADLWNDFNGPGRGSYRKIANAPDNYPIPGDVIIWAANVPGVTGPAGHVAIVLAANINSFVSFDQNYPTGTFPHEQTHINYRGVLGWLRPIVNDPPVPAPVVIPLPDPQVLPTPAPVVVTPGPVEGGRGNGQPSGPVTVTVAPKEPVNVLEDDYDSTFVAFPETREIHLKYDTLAIDMTGEHAPKAVVATLPLRVSGIFTDNGRKYYRGTSGGWYAVSADDVVEDQSTDSPDEPRKASFLANLIRDPLGAFIRFIARIGS